MVQILREPKAPSSFPHTSIQKSTVDGTLFSTNSGYGQRQDVVARDFTTRRRGGTEQQQTSSSQSRSQISTGKCMDVASSLSSLSLCERGFVRLTMAWSSFILHDWLHKNESKQASKPPSLSLCPCCCVKNGRFANTYKKSTRESCLSCSVSLLFVVDVVARLTMVQQGNNHGDALHTCVCECVSLPCLVYEYAPFTFPVSMVVVARRALTRTQKKQHTTCCLPFVVSLAHVMHKR